MVFRRVPFRHSSTQMVSTNWPVTVSRPVSVPVAPLILKDGFPGMGLLAEAGFKKPMGA
jgi:hypothetical protein